MRSQQASCSWPGEQHAVNGMSWGSTPRTGVIWVENRDQMSPVAVTAICCG